MAKKNFSAGIDNLLQQTIPKGELSKKTSNKSEDFTSYTRTTLIVNRDTYEKIKAIAYWERKSIKDVIEDGFQYILSKYPSEQIAKICETFKSSG